jgi:hypothetical protein
MSPLKATLKIFSCLISFPGCEMTFTARPFISDPFVGPEIGEISVGSSDFLYLRFASRPTRSIKSFQFTRTCQRDHSYFRNANDMTATLPGETTLTV